MPRLTPWAWWVGSESSVADDRAYEINECVSRDAAIASGLAETAMGDRFHIVEARVWQDHNSLLLEAEIDRFGRERNHETFMVTAPGEYLAVPGKRAAAPPRKPIPRDASVAAPATSMP